MARIQPNFSEAMTFGATVPGLYKLQVIGSSTDVSREKRTPLAIFKMVVAEVIKAPDEARNEIGREITRNMPLNGKGSGFLKEFLLALGRKDIADQDQPDFDTEELHGEFVGAELINRTYKDEADQERTSPEVRRFFPV